MEIKFSQVNKSRASLQVVITAAEMNKHFDEAYNAMAPSVNLPGFRPGKAPKTMTIEAIGRQRLANAAIEEAIRSTYIKAIRDHKLNPLGSPNVTIEKQPSFIEGSENVLQYSAQIDSLPEVKFIIDYKKLRVSPAPRENLKIGDKDVEAAIREIACRRSTFKPVTRGAKKGDKLEITFQGFDGHVALEKLASKNHPLILGTNVLIPGFEDKLLGIKKGEKREFDITFPTQYHAKEFAGKKYRFKVTADAVEETIAPKIDDQFAKDLGAKSFDDLRKLLRANLEQEQKNRATQKQEDEVVQQIAKIARTDLPEVLVNSEKARLQKIIEDIAQKQNVTLDQYLENVQTTKEKFDEDTGRQAAKNVLIGLSLRQIALNEKIELSKDESLTKVVRWLIEQYQPAHKVQGS